MKFKLFYGQPPKLSEKDADLFSDDDYTCCALFRTRWGKPVIVAQHKTMDLWAVRYGFSTIVFATKAEALAYCRGRFYDLDGKAV